MIAPKNLAERYKKWNYKYGAPFGRKLKHRRLRRWLSRKRYLKLVGLFGSQLNNTTRLFEYPWAFHATPIKPGLRVLEIGGGLSGFQFVLDKCDCRVTNVDPGLNAGDQGKFCEAAAMAELNHVFGTSVELLNTTINNANLEPLSLDRVFSISVVEHLDDQEIEDIMSIAFRSLIPGGYFVLTVDLFLNTAPFISQKRNKFGRNTNVNRLVEKAPFTLVQGNQNELNGYAEFDPDRIQSNLQDYFIGQYYPTLVQCIVLQKPH